ncbi:MAG: (5-formylfuran-3-yl)methyl phosphate synthase [Candidatus Bathyarchaeia archaeon]
MKLLVSVINEDEALEAIKGGCDILDIKNPKEGSLGANHPSITRRIVELFKNKAKISVTIGDLPNLPGTASLAALGAASLGVDYIKAGLYGVKSFNEALSLMDWIVKAVKEFYPEVKIIACGYADYNLINSLNPINLPAIAYESNANGILIDVKNKTSKKLFQYLSLEALSGIIDKAHEYGLTVALAGALSKEDIGIVKKLKADIIGVRRCVCDKHKWLNGKVKSEKVKEMLIVIKSLNP